MQRLVIIVGKIISAFSTTLGFGAGATWPGEIALRLTPTIFTYLASQLRQGIILVAGTNGKTTTALMVKAILQKEGLTVVHNDSGANLDNGLVSALIQSSDWSGRVNRDWGVFEVDENTLAQILKFISPRVVVLLNLFRDQLDRYGEIDVIVEKWKKGLRELDKETTIVLNCDDPQIAHLGKTIRAKVVYFGLNDKKYFFSGREHATDSTFCLNCNSRLSYSGIFFSHLGVWRCQHCGQSRPKPQLSQCKSPLPGLYNLYNTLAAVSAAREIKIPDRVINGALSSFTPAFGRQEEFKFDGKKVKIFLSKNPVGFNASLRTVLELKPKALILVLNDRIPDGRDVSWIWDVDIEMIPSSVKLIISGDRVYDMALRIRYASEEQGAKKEVSKEVIMEEDLRKAVCKGLALVKQGDTLYILPTYSAMLEVRKILTGKRIL